ncbi:MAG: FtsW/RodA/SpoVE family cell cycle protein [Coriobacteriia bacterium]|nr:FtsW/RodA/SpoVE family cell cycle protein [Coriobacteriia bacterium]
MTRRATELSLMLAATPVLALLYAMAIITDGSPLTLNNVVVPVGLLAAFLIAHLALRRLAPAADSAILPIVFMLSGIGIAFVMRLAPSLATRQIMWLFLSIAAMITVLVLVPNISILTDYKYTMMLAGLILLILPAFVGTEIYGSRIWLTFFGFSFQPGEIAKVLVVIFLAGYLADNREMLSAASRRVAGIHFPDPRAVAPLLIMWILSLVILVFERDLGSAMLFFGIFLVMIYVSTGRLVYIVAGVLLALIGCFAAYHLFSHVQLRISIWRDPFADRYRGGYQLIQALYSLADGGLFGTGIGRGMPEFIPVVASDFIFVAIAEEMGLLGASAILMLFLLFAVRGLTVAARARSDVDSFTAAGLTAAITLQAFVIIGGTTRLIPMTGVTLPFVSQGGSSLLSSFIIVGLLLRAGASGTGHATEMIGVPGFEGGILGRLTLGRRLTFFMATLACMFALCIVNLSWYMVVQAEALQADPMNSHTIARNTNAPRGAIISSDGVVYAYSERDNTGRWRRYYPQGYSAAHIVGYQSATYGAAGIEARYGDTLAGRRGYATWNAAFGALSGQALPGNDVILTIDSRIQRAADATLGNLRGAVVVLDANTGEVLALASTPGFDPAEIDQILGSVGDDGTGAGGGSSQLYNRATQALYAPGSTFKVVTLFAALDGGVATLESGYDSPPRIEIGGADVTSFHLNDYGHVTLQRAFELSSNTVFAQVASQMGARQLVRSAERFGFNRQLTTDFDINISLMPDPSEMTEWEIAWAGVGQPVGEHRSPAGPQVTVMQMALVAATIANDGEMMRPYVVRQVTSAEGFVISQAAPQSLGRVMSIQTADQIRKAMLGVVEAGTGMDARVYGYQVYGKTGTAETSNLVEDSWFIGWIEIDGECYVVAIVLEQQPSGTAAYHAREVFEALVEAYGR